MAQCMENTKRPVHECMMLLYKSVALSHLIDSSTEHSMSQDWYGSNISRFEANGEGDYGYKDFYKRRLRVSDSVCRI